LEGIFWIGFFAAARSMDCYRHRLKGNQAMSFNRLPTYLCIIALTLSACAKIDTSNSCLSGMCTSKEKSLNNILWNPVNLENKNCPDISGKYKGNENLIAQFDFRNSRLDKKSTTYESHKEIPFVSIIKIKNTLPGQKILPDNNTYLYSDSSEFYENSHIDIEQLANTLTISIKDSKNVLYRRYGISLAPPDIGCNNDYLVFRWANTVGSAEGALGSAFATEKKFRKLPNGSLEIHITTREWYYSSSVGLIGIGTDGHASGIEPRHVDKVLIFSPIN